jgi:hypothetical protein
VPERRAALENDISMLGVIDQLPSLAPFLVRDRLERAGFPVDDRYVQVSVDEWDEISLFIRAQFQKIIEAVFGARAGTGGKVDQLLQKLWDLSDKPALEELARAFRLPAEGCEATFYAWKGVIYFTYEYGTYAERIRRFVHWLQNDATVPAHTAAPLPAECARLRQVILDRIGADLVQINQRLTAYSSAFNDLFQQGKGAASFLDFLARASEHFNVLGIAIGRVQHTTLVWDKFTGRLSGRAPRPEMLVELLAALAQILGEPTGNKAIAATLAPR